MSPTSPPNEQMFPFRLSSQERSPFSRERNAFYYHLNRRRVAGWSCAFAKKPKPSPKAWRLTRGEGSVNGQVLRTQRQRDRCLFIFSASRVKARRCFPAAGHASKPRRREEGRNNRSSAVPEPPLAWCMPNIPGAKKQSTNTLLLRYSRFFWYLYFT